MNYNLTVGTPSNGSVSPAPGTYNEASGTQVTLTATVNSGYQLDHWTVDGASVPASGNTFVVLMNAAHSVTPVFMAITATAAWAFNYWNGNAWTPLQGAMLDSQGIMEELNGQELVVLDIPNTPANQTALGVDSPSSANVKVQVLYRRNQIYLGVCTGAQITKANLQCIIYNPVFLALKQAPNTVTYNGVNTDAAQILSAILTQAFPTLSVYGNCAITTPITLILNNANAFDAIVALAKVCNADYWATVPAANYLQINIGTRDATTYNDSNFNYEVTTQRGFDRAQQFGTVIVMGTDAQTGAAIQGQAGSSGAVKVFVYSVPSDINTLNSLAAYELSSVNSPSTGNPLSILTDVAYNWHPGQYVTINRPDLALVGTFIIQRITKGSVLTTVEVDVAVPRIDVNLQALTAQVQSVAINQT
jgi:hypothetical protein